MSRGTADGQRFPWKRSFRRIPKGVLVQLDRVHADLVVVAATKKVAVSEVAKGMYRHLRLGTDGAGLVVSAPVVPRASVGRYSDKNRHGWEVVRDDLPMVTKTYSWQTPNFGDASTYGTHTHYRDRDVYQRECFEPPYFAISVEVLKQDERQDTALIKFAVENVLDRTRDDFQEDLFFCLNLLQENTGVTGVYPSTATRDDFISTISLDWEFFPPGAVPEVVAALSSGRGVRSARASVVAERVELFAKLRPLRYLRGSGGSFNSYIGAQFADDLVVFENVTYGNALYVLYEGWETISQRSRLDLLKGTTESFDRFPHVDDWEQRFIEHMAGELERRGIRRRWQDAG